MIYLPDQTTEAVVNVGVVIWRIGSAEGSVAETSANDCHERGRNCQAPQSQAEDFPR